MNFNRRTNSLMGCRQCGCEAASVADPPALAAKALLQDPEITVVEVARRLGVAASTLYRHLPRASTVAPKA